MRKLTFLLTVLMLLCIGIGAKAGGIQNVDGIMYFYEYSTKTAEVSHSSTYTGDIVIPEQVNIYGEPYTIIGVRESAFNGCAGLTSVTLPATVTTIGQSAFYNCSALTFVNIPEGITIIGSNTFCNCSSLKSITLPTSLTDIGDGAFQQTGLESITITPNVESIGKNAFYANDNLKTIHIQAPYPPTLGEDAFFDLPSDYVVYIPIGSLSDYQAADGWKDLNLQPEIPDEVIGGVHYFFNSDYTAMVRSMLYYLPQYAGDIVIPEQVEYEGHNYTVTTIDQYAFDDCKELTSVILPPTITEIGESAFRTCSALRDINIPEDIKVLNDYTFLNCSSLKSITLPTSLTDIGERAFQQTGLESITITPNVQSIGKNAFYANDNLKTIHIQAPYPPTLGENAFFDLPSDYVIYVPGASLSAYQEADGWKDLNLSKPAEEIVIDLINAIGSPITLESEPAIVAARGAYDALTDAQKALVTNYATLSAAEAKLDQLKKQAAADQAAADLVIGKINAIGTVSYTTASKALIDAARGAYDALTDAQKALVTNYATLTAAEKTYADLKAQAEADQAAANVVINQIDAIGEVTLASEPAIVAARGAYDALTDAQKALVTNYATLTAAEAKLEILKKQAESDVAAAAAVTDLINGIGAISYTTESKALIDAAREAYNALTDAQKALVPNYATLVAAEQVYEQLKAEAEADQKAANVVIDLIDQIGEVTLASEPAINAARTAYNSLTSIQQELVTNYGTLLAAETTLELLKQQATIDQAMADDVIARIEAIGEVTYTNNCYSRIFYARAAYDALSDVQKALVTNYATLTAAEARYAELEAQAKAVEEAKTQLKALVSEAAELKAVAMLYSPASVEQIDAIIANAQQTINDPYATVEDVNAKTEIIRGEIQFVGAALLEEAKEQLRQSIKALYHSGDYPSWYAAVIIPALNQVDEIMWDNDKTVQENILFFQTTGKAIYDTAKAALEALRTSDTREIVSSCEFTGFTDAITVGMMWNEAALNTLVANLNASAATQPYRFIAEECMLTKWDAEYELFVGVDHNEGVVLTPGDYQFVANISIDGDDAAKFRFPKASEATLSVTVDAAVWSVDLAGIVIDATYSSAYTASPTFTLSEGQGIDETQDAQLKTQKIYHNGHFYILRGEHIYDIRGTLVR